MYILCLAESKKDEGTGSDVISLSNAVWRGGEKVAVAGTSKCQCHCANDWFMMLMSSIRLNEAFVPG